MSEKEQLLTPVGRLVQGSLYEPQTTDVENKPLTIRTGPNAGQPRVDYYFGLAIPKGNERHWSETTWGMKIWAVGCRDFPNGQTNSPQFAWKVQDGDNNVPNKVGRKNCDKEGFPGHWVLNFSSGFQSQIYNEDGTAQILENNSVNLGDWIQVYGSVAGNGSSQQPGVFLNHQMIAFHYYGKRIVLGADPKSVGFGNSGSIPMGASKTPLAQGFNPAVPHPTPHPVAAVYTVGAILPPTPHIPPHPGILTPPVPVSAPQRLMLPPSKGATYEQMIVAGWTDALLIQHGMMAP